MAPRPGFEPGARARQARMLDRATPPGLLISLLKYNLFLYFLRIEDERINLWLTCSIYLRARSSVWIERWPSEPEVPGSNPGGPVKLFK